MPQQPTSIGGANQTLLELIYSLKGLAQTVEFLHQDLSRKLDEESKARIRELDRLREMIGKNSQALNVLPITFSDRTEKLINKMKEDVGEKLRDVEDAVTEVRNRLESYSRTAERAISQTDAAVEREADERADITGRIEVTKAGNIKVQVNSTLLKKLWYGIIALAAGGGVYGIKEAVAALLGG